ncbi:hypothetical protein, partial [Ruminococcus callidus]|uniref:hypothetical protein n=2 Tax=Ruminococcus callidus TaxID=40519 RepID=UPI0023F8EEFE
QYKWNANSFLFLLLFFFSVKKKRSVTPCEIGWLLWRGTPQSPAVTAQHKARPSGALKGSLEMQTCKRRMK